MRRIALKVAVQPPLPLRDRERIFRQREMIHPDVDVSRRDEFLRCKPEQLQLHLRRGDLFADDLLLRLESGGQMRVVVNGDAVGPQIGDSIERCLERPQRLAWKPVDEIHAHGSEPRSPRLLHHRGRLRFALHAVDGTLNVRIEVLDAEAHPVETKAAQCCDRRGLHGPRVDLDRILAVGRELELRLAAWRKARKALRFRRTSACLRPSASAR